MLTQKIKIINKLGIHARAASKFVSHAKRYVSDIKVIKGKQVANGKSIMGIIMLAAKYGTILELIIDGPDAEAMNEDLCGLINDLFGEEE